MNKLEIVLCDSNNDGNLKYRYTVLDPFGYTLIVTSSYFLAEMYLKK
jgi:hypothetical protein